MIVLMVYFQHRGYAFRVSRAATIFQRDTVRETRLCVTFYFVCCALLIHTFLASNNETRERNLEGQKIRERMIVGCKLVVLRCYTVLWFLFGIFL